ncbi:mitochondrial Homoaconitase [Hypoxylon texense]
MISGPPPGLKLPPGIVTSGKLPPWPKITIGKDNVPTYSDKPTSCETESATILLTTTSFGVSTSNSATVTTATQVLSTSSVILGCDVEDESSTSTTTASCPTSATTCTEADIITLSVDANDPVPTEELVNNDALAISVYDYVESFWSAQDAAATSSTFTTSTISAPLTTSSSATRTSSPPSSSKTTTTTTSAASPTATWFLTLGYGKQQLHETCISLKKNLPQESETSESCEWFTNGGHSAGAACSAGTFDKPTSFLIRSGFCTVYSEDGCTGDSNGITSTEYTGCTNTGDLITFPDTWRSMQCFAINAK